MSSKQKIVDFGGLLRESLKIDQLTPTTELVPEKKPNAITYTKAAALELDRETSLIRKQRNSLSTRQQTVKEAFRNFEDAVGGRVELREVLKHCPTDSPVYKSLSKLFSDIDFNAPSDVALSLICNRHKVNLGTILQAFRDAKAAQMITETVARLVAHVPDVVDDTAFDAKSGYDICHVCEGNGRIPQIGPDGEFLVLDDEMQTQMCHECRGRGRLWKQGDVQNRKMFFELTGIMKPKGADKVTVQIANVGGNFQPGDGSYENLVKAIDRVALGGPKEEVLEVPYTVWEQTEDNTTKQPVSATESVREP